MEDKMHLLLDKINFDKDKYNYFKDAKLSKIVISKNKSNCNIYIDTNIYLPIDIVEELDFKIKNIDNSIEEYNVIYNVLNKDYSYLLNYYPYILKQLKDELIVLEIYKDALVYEDNKLILVATNNLEYDKLTNCLYKINAFYKKFSYDYSIEIELRKDENILKEIKSDLEKSIQVDKI